MQVDAQSGTCVHAVRTWVLAGEGKLGFFSSSQIFGKKSELKKRRKYTKYSDQN
jgi:hypothetical protein